VALRVQRHVQSIAGRELKDQLLTFIADETASFAAGERLAGSRENLETPTRSPKPAQRVPCELMRSTSPDFQRPRASLYEFCAVFQNR
jgi:hypothetical protein